MKTKNISALIVTMLLSVASINAAGLLNENDLLLAPGKNTPTKPACTSRTVPSNAHTTAPNPAEGEPVVTVKLYGVSGELLSLQQVTMQEFMVSTFPEECLPDGSTFVMYHGNTAYYQVP
jgi:hypothetical protein